MITDGTSGQGLPFGGLESPECRDRYLFLSGVCLSERGHGPLYMAPLDSVMTPSGDTLVQMHAEEGARPQIIGLSLEMAGGSVKYIANSDGLRVERETEAGTIHREVKSPRVLARVLGIATERIINEEDRISQELAADLAKDKMPALSHESQELIDKGAEEAKKRGNNSYGSEYLLLALLCDNDIASTSLGANMTYEEATVGVDRVFSGGLELREPPAYTPRMKRVLGAAKVAALSLKSAEIKPIHLALGLLEVGLADKAGVAYRIMIDHPGIDVEALEEEFLDLAKTKE